MGDPGPGAGSWGPHRPCRDPREARPQAPAGLEPYVAELADFVAEHHFQGLHCCVLYRGAGAAEVGLGLAGGATDAPAEDV